MIQHHHYALHEEKRTTIFLITRYNTHEKNSHIQKCNVTLVGKNEKSREGVDSGKGRIQSESCQDKELLSSYKIRCCNIFNKMHQITKQKGKYYK